MSSPVTAAEVAARLAELASPAELAKVRRRLPAAEPALGVRMRDVFDTAKAAASMSDAELDLLMAEPTYESRMAAFSILDFQARADPGSPRLCARYLAHHDRVTTWDMVDRAAPRVVGSALAGGPYEVLHELAASPDPLRRRSAITAPLWFVRYGTDPDVAAGFEIAAVLHADPEPTVHKSVGIFLAHAGTRAPERLAEFLAEYGEAMPSAARRLATRKQVTT